MGSDNNASHESDDDPSTSDDNDGSLNHEYIDEESSGIIFISRIPPYMGVSKLRSYFSHFGKIGKIYAHPESITDYKKRVKLGGNKKLKFTHGWIQFHDKKIARKVAILLNNKPVGDKRKNSFWSQDLWNIRYLPKFKWRHLVEYWSKHKRERKEKLSVLIAKEKKENYHYLDQLEREKQQTHILLKRQKRNPDFTPDDTKKVVGDTAESKEESKDIPVGLLDAIVL